MPEFNYHPERPASRPCLDQPGSEGKVEELARRVACREELHHADDLTHDAAISDIREFLGLVRRCQVQVEAAQRRQSAAIDQAYAELCESYKPEAAKRLAKSTASTVTVTPIGRTGLKRRCKEPSVIQ